MTYSKNKLNVFQKLSKEKILELADFFNENILRTTEDMKEFEQRLDGESLTSFELDQTVSAFVEFAIDKPHPEKIIELINTSNLDQDKKSVLKDVLIKIHSKIDLDRVQINSEMDFLEMFGHPHLHKFATVTEYRPILRDGKIIKFVPSIIISGTVHNPNVDEEDDSFNIQISIESLECIIRNLDDHVKTTKTQILEMKNKFGDDIID